MGDVPRMREEREKGKEIEEEEKAEEDDNEEKEEEAEEGVLDKEPGLLK